MERIILGRLRYKIPHLHPNLFVFSKKICFYDNTPSLRSCVDKRSVLILLDLEKTFELADPLSITVILAEKNIKVKLLGNYFMITLLIV